MPTPPLPTDGNIANPYALSKKDLHAGIAVLEISNSLLSLLILNILISSGFLIYLDPTLHEPV